VPDFPLLAHVLKGLCQPFGDAKLAIEPTEQNRTDVGAQRGIHKRRCDGSAADGKEVNLRSTLCHDAGTSSVL
jgi:hypothetical protein